VHSSSNDEARILPNVSATDLRIDARQSWLAVFIGCQTELGEIFNFAADPDEKNAEVLEHARG